MKKILFITIILFSILGKLKSQQQVYQINSGTNLSDFNFTDCSGFVTDSYNPRKVTFQDGFSITCGRFYKQYINNTVAALVQNYDSIVVKVKYKTSPGYARAVRIQSTVIMTTMYDVQKNMVTAEDSGYIYFNTGTYPTYLTFDVQLIVSKSDTSLNNFFVYFYGADLKAYATLPGVGINESFSENNNWWHFDHVLYANDGLINKNIEIYNTLGQNVLSKKIEGKKLELPLERGIYFIQLDGKRKKIIID